MDFEAKYPLSRDEIRYLANLFRKKFKINTIKFPVLKVLDLLEQKYEGILYTLIEPDDSFEKTQMAYLEQENSELYCIHIRESVYNAATKNRRDYLGFICHEIAHFILIYIFENGPKYGQYARNMEINRYLRKEELKPFRSMEWQAKCLCGELMIPYEKCKDKSFKQIIWQTKSSNEQVRYFLEKVCKSK